MGNLIEVAQKLQDDAWPIILNIVPPEVWMQYRRSMTDRNDPFAVVDSIRRDLEGDDG